MSKARKIAAGLSELVNSAEPSFTCNINLPTTKFQSPVASRLYMQCFIAVSLDV
jgi:hypothetical protein